MFSFLPHDSVTPPWDFHPPSTKCWLPIFEPHLAASPSLLMPWLPHQVWCAHIPSAAKFQQFFCFSLCQKSSKHFLAFCTRYLQFLVWKALAQNEQKHLISKWSPTLLFLSVHVKAFCSRVCQLFSSNSVLMRGCANWNYTATSWVPSCSCVGERTNL